MTVKVIEVLITLKFTFFFPSYKSTTSHIYIYIAIFIHDKNITGTIFWAE